MFCILSVIIFTVCDTNWGAFCDLDNSKFNVFKQLKLNATHLCIKSYFYWITESHGNASVAAPPYSIQYTQPTISHNTLVDGCMHADACVRVFVA